MNTSLSVVGGVKLVIRTWRQHRATARLHNDRRKIREALRKIYSELCDTKCFALKATGVFQTEHTTLEAAIVSLAYAMQEYSDPV